MSPPRLPADLSAWPKDPFAVLGVERTVDRRSLKRAYTTLLREFTPEHFPDHFRRLREAYEIVLRQVEWCEARFVQQPIDSPEELPPAEPVQQINDAVTDPSAPSPSSSSDELSPKLDPSSPAAAHRWYDDLDKLWQRAIDGDEGAYRQLVDIEARFSGRRDLCLRLYWLLVAWPELDPRREACDWLVRGLKLGGLAGPLAELYRRELDERPGESLTDRCAELFDAPSQPGPLADLVAARWRAAGRLGQFEPIPEDLERLRERLFPAAEEVWCRLLLAAVEQLSWSPSPELQRVADSFWEEVDELPHLHSRLQQDLDRVETMRSVAAGWHKVSGSAGIPPDLLSLVRLSTQCDADEVTPPALRLLRGLLVPDARLLTLFDNIHKASPAVLGQIGRIIALCGGQDGGEPRQDANQIRTLVQLTIAAGYSKNYESVRLHLLRFCLREQISPDALVRLPGLNLAQSENVNTALLRSIAADAPLRLVYLAHRALGA